MTPARELVGRPGRTGVGAGWRAHLLTVGAGVVVVASGFVAGSPPSSPTAQVPPWYLVVMQVCAVTALLVRHRWSHLAVVVTVGVLAVAEALDAVSLGFSLAVVVCLAPLVARRSRARSLVLAALILVAVVVPALLVRPGSATDGTLVQTALVLGLATALGDALRLHREQLAGYVARAEQAEASREAEARRQVTDERLRFARDLHDAVAHQIAVINLHAGAAQQSLAHRPEAAQQSLAIIQQAAREVLSEINSLLTWLRHEEDGDVTAAAETPDGHRGLADVGRLADAMTAAGMPVDLAQRGRPARQPAHIDHIAYRVAREALTNAYKHGDRSRATLSMTWTADSLVIDCRNPVATSLPAGPPRAGHGLTGMKELVRTVGGTVVAAATDGRHRLVVTLPHQEQPT
ncbi:sensor histidine kinase [Jannaschia sp. R86511]|uniref:sensor histidine kinase n=1 Tax=Jannaschia sp. R86511 TaxID=3093853 RepID=UPI0036D33BEB